MTAGILAAKLGYRHPKVGSDPEVGRHSARRSLAGALAAPVSSFEEESQRKKRKKPRRRRRCHETDRHPHDRRCCDLDGDGVGGLSRYLLRLAGEVIEPAGG